MEEAVKSADTTDEGNDEASSSRVATFRGRLNMADYIFAPKAENSLPDSRRSPRKWAIATSSPKRKLDSLTTAVSPKKKSRSPSGYAPPETYAHLSELVDILEPNLICVFVGLNPGVSTAESGHAYAHPSNLFWKLLHSSGLTMRRCRPEEDGDLPRLFQMGLTNIVARPTKNGAELSKAEMDARVHILEDKIKKYKPEVVCIVGKSIWESIWRVQHGKGIKKDQFIYGWQNEEENMGGISEEGWKGSKVFVATSTSGLAATLLPAEKEEIWRELGVWAEQRRIERAVSENEI